MFTYDKLWKPIGGAPGYRIESKTIKGIEEYKSNAKNFAFAHLWFLTFVMCLYCVLHLIPKFALILEIILNSYCIMTQRYHCIRINEILEKHRELEKRRLEKSKLEEENTGNRQGIDLNPTKQLAKAEKQEHQLAFKEVFYCENSSEILEQENSKFDDGFTRTLRRKI